jgi:hypothetical protein
MAGHKRDQPEIRTVEVTRYVTPLREGGSMPAIVEADDEFLYVLKFRGAGQGVKALIAELLGGEIARVIGLRVPEIVFAQLDPILSRTEGDEEIQDLIKFSGGLNIGLHYLSGAISFDPLVSNIDAITASKIVWLDSLILNVDRTPRNSNMLIWHKELWLIDHGASFYLHHADPDISHQGEKAFPMILDHILLPLANELANVDEAMREILTNAKLKAIVSLIPDEWLKADSPGLTPDKRKQAYYQFLITRVASSKKFVNEAQHARKTLI